MQLIRAQRPIGLDYVRDHLSDEEMNLWRGWLEDELENALVLLMFDGDEPQAFLLAYNFPGMEWVQVDRVWFSKELKGKREIGGRLLKRCVQWADVRDVKELRTEGKGFTGKVMRSLGMSPLYEVLSLDVEKTLDGNVAAK
jgi:hypothetical protein